MAGEIPIHELLSSVLLISGFILSVCSSSKGFSVKFCPVFFILVTKCSLGSSCKLFVSSEFIDSSEEIELFSTSIVSNLTFLVWKIDWLYSRWLYAI